MKKVRRSQAVLLLAAGFALLLSIALTPTIASNSKPSQSKGDPLAPMVFTVNSAADTNDGTCDAVNCTLREAILAANLNSGADTINFQIGSGLQTITLLTGLPAVLDTLTIDGSTQPGFSTKPIIELDGSMLGKGINGLSISAANCVIRGLVINRFEGDGIAINTSNNVIQGNFIGTNPAGASSLGNAESGISITGGSNNLIGGTTAQARNLISGNLNNGILVFGSSSTGNQIKGNLIGLDFTGTVDLGNGADGVSIFASPGNIVGGAEAGARNVISGNTGKGVSVLISDATGNQVLGNFIGTDISGALDRGNSSDGIDLFNAVNTIIGGASPGSRNVISGNDAFGVRMNLSTGNQIKGNLIGTRADGTGSLGNSFRGVSIANSSNNNPIGGTAGGEGNVIANNGQAGVFVEQGTGNSIRSNSIFSNVGLGIDLGPQGVTPNDAGDVDAGANNLQNFPVITTAISTQGGESNFQGTINSTPNTSFRIELFSNSACDPAGNGEGQNFIGSTQVNTNGSGNASFDVTIPTAVAPGSFITATATDPSGNTSEFSACLTFLGLADLSISKGASPDPALGGSNVTFTMTVSNSGPNAAQMVTVIDNLPSSVTFLNCSSTAGGICGGTGNNRTVTFSSIPAQSSAVITIVARVNCTVADGSIIANTATVSSAVTSDPNTGNNSSTSMTSVSNPPPVLTPASATFAGSGGSAMVAVTIPAGCTWTATSNAPWIHITSGGGTGNGTVLYTVDEYMDPTPRMGTMTIAGRTFTINQSNVACSYTIMPASASFSAMGGTGNVMVTALDGCRWTAQSNVPWVTVTSGGSGSGSGTVTFSVEVNTSESRGGTITIAGQDFVVMQAGGCLFLLDPISLSFDTGGGQGSFNLMTGSGCLWTATSNDSWIVVTPPVSGSGNATINFQVAANPDERFRTGTITIGGGTFTVKQQGTGSGTCNNVINPTFSSFSAGGGRASVSVFALAECFWTAVSNVNWVTINVGSSGLGNGAVDYSVQPNTTGAARVGTISIAGKTFTVKQKGS
jgi:CSLREA domain-containing protein/uncharacterized repeat protein (TIGR01451 family)